MENNQISFLGPLTQSNWYACAVFYGSPVADSTIIFPPWAQSSADIWPLIENANSQTRAKQSSVQLPAMLVRGAGPLHSIMLWVTCPFCPHKLWKIHAFRRVPITCRVEETIFYFGLSIFAFWKVKYPALFTMYSYGLLRQTKQMSKQFLFALLVCQCEWVCHLCLLVMCKLKYHQ